MAALLTLLAAAFAAPPDLITTFAASAPVDVIVMLDTTFGKDQPAKDAREGIASLVRGLSDGDSVSVFAYHTRVTPVLPREAIAASSREALATRISTLEFPSARDTDLGAALSAVVDALVADTNGGLDVVLFVSDFCHAPPVTSEYDAGGSGCRSVRGVSDLAARLPKGRADLVLSYVFPAATVPSNEAGILAVNGVLPTRQRIDPPRTLTLWAPELLGELPTVRSRPAVTQAVADLKLIASVVTPPNNGDTDVEIELTVSDPRLGLRLTGLTANGVPVAGEPLVLAPSARVRVPIPTMEAPFSLVPRTDVVDVPLTLKADGAVEPADVLDGLGVSSSRPGMQVAVTAEVRRRYGVAATTSFGLLFTAGLVVTGLVFGIRSYTVPLRLGGRFVWRKGGGARLEFPVSGLAEVAVSIDTDGRLIVGKPESAVLIIRMQRTGWGTRADVEIRRDGVEINSRPASRGRHDVVPGATSFLWDDYRLTWE